MEAQVRPASHVLQPWSPSPEAGETVKRIHAMLHPRNIVLVGATDKPGNYAERIWNNLVKYQYEGGLYPVNSKRETIWAYPATRTSRACRRNRTMYWCWCRLASPCR